MRAIEYLRYGAPEVLHLIETAMPCPKSNEVLIRVYATSVTAADIMMRTGKPFVGRFYTGLNGPKRTIPGFEFAGKVTAVGNAVTLFKVDDEVFGGTIGLGCYAEYVCVSENDVLITMPDNISYEEAAPVNGSAITVMNFLKGLGNIQKNQKVLINGASGGLGTYAIQIAKHFGAVVTGVCSTNNLGLVISLGADKVIDYTKEDFTQNGEQYDIIFDTVGKRSYLQCKNSLTEKGIYLSTVISFTLFLQIICTSLFGSKKAKSSATGMLSVQARLNYFEELRELMETGKIKTVIDTTYSLSEIAKAHEYVEKGHKKGNVVITISDLSS
ncbi:NAD(P)-dependent alcohol dehydrogenase [Flavobacterium soyangense]|uniref:NAD(P)-dependent alcohol dehydrogenase n=1 Tax=Flavobacterium soyangense TaxID=2023265 RepID=A0A930XTU5_9FLAO|nr:NAD(P)-dependent alcohol dehydrogenase [Flavobacterium soyangense]MBF2707865.1 NAD(P)-dependent alcohol dehydrogenase [Flavobacterium soyangense]